MVLSRHINAEEVALSTRSHSSASAKWYGNTMTSPYGSKYSAESSIPRYKIPDGGTPADVVYRLMSDELELDGRPNLNLASFVHTYMEPMADKLMADHMSKNLADVDEYPAMIDIQARCVSILSNLWHAQEGEHAIGTPTTGSSEAIHLAGLAMKTRWKEKMEAKGKDTTKPNIIMAANAQVALEKFARYFDVEARILPVSEKSHYCLDPNLVLDSVDENTIGIFVILGSTYTGHYEPVEQVSQILDKYEKDSGNDVPIHVDGASGAMFAPFAHPDVIWDFKLPRVKSINTSGHKYGQTYAGLGWLIFRDEQYLPKHLVFELHYLGGTEQTYTLNFSRPGSQMLAQYFNFVHLGFEGYRNINSNDLINARVLSTSLEESGYYFCVSDIHRAKGTFTSGKKESVEDLDREPEYFNAGLPVVSFRLSDEYKKENPHVNQASIAALIRQKGWIIPNYPLPPGEDKTEILRVVVRESFSADLGDKLFGDLIECAETLAQSSDKVYLTALGTTTPHSNNHPSKKFASLGAKLKEHRGKHNKTHGVYHAVC